MQRVYLLLRHNQQTGPYKLEELIQFDLKPFDLIWIEGKSAGWYYPQEIKALRPHLPFVKQEPQAPTKMASQTEAAQAVDNAGLKKVFVSMPAGTTPPVQTTYNSLPDYNIKTAAPSAASFQPKEEAAIETSNAKSLYEREAGYNNQGYQQAKKKTVSLKKGLVAACLIAAVAFAAWWALKADSVKEDTVSEQTFIPAENDMSPDSSGELDMLQATLSKPSIKQAPKKPVAAKNKVALASQEQIAKPQTKTIADNTPKNETISDEELPAVQDESKMVTDEKTKEPSTQAPQEKKKLRDKIADLFKKKPEAKTEEAKPAEDEDGRRSSTRRESGSTLAQMINIRFTVPNDWMMGIEGAKATLTNRSSETIGKATIEVHYFNDENEMLEKKTIAFSNIKSKQTQTVAVPDHATATRLEYKVISAVGENEPFASR